MAPGKPRDARKEQQWRRWLRQYQASGLTVQAFCARWGLAQPSFYAWRRELRRRDAAALPVVPVHVLGDQRPLPRQPLEVVLPGGRTLRVGLGFDPALLRQLLAVLEEAPSC